MSRSYFEQTIRFLNLENLTNDDGTYKLIFHNGCFLIYTGKKYERIADNRKIDRMLILASEKHDNLLENTSAFVLGNIIRNLEAICFVENIQEAQMRNEVKDSQTHYIPLRNGILKLEITTNGLIKTLIPHTHLFFCTYTLPYDFAPNATAPTFKKFSEEVLGADSLKTLQQFIGYCFLPLAILEYAVFLLGSGANGKSAFCTVIKTLIGFENISPTPLDELFEKYSLIEIVDKLINLVEEANDSHFHDVAKLKDFISGGMFFANVKYGRKFPFHARTKLIFATNTIPKLKDSSNGMKRRILIIEFKKQFLDPKKQDKRLKSTDFWIESGELSGVFNWALKGLEDLIMQSWQLSLPQEVLSAAEENDKHSNPIKYFIDDHVEVYPSGKIFCSDLHGEYKAFCKLHGFPCENSIRFTIALKNQLPSVTQTKNQIRRTGKLKDRMYLGLRHKKLEPSQEVFDSYNITSSNFSQVSQMALLTQQLSANIFNSNSTFTDKCSLLTINEREVFNEK